MKFEFLYNGFLIEKHRFTGKFRKFETLSQAKEYINNFIME